MRDSRVVIITGMSGSGKSIAIKALEDLGFFCIDNLPVELLSKLIELGDFGRGAEISKFALVMDAREPRFPERALDLIPTLKKQNYHIEIVFLDADDEILQRRYSETRRSHPAAGTGGVADGIRNERIRLADLKELADWVIDTSQTKPQDLRIRIQDHFAGEDTSQMRVRLMSFGFKYGPPGDADLIMDVRFLPNPFFIEELRPLTGLEKAVSDYVLQNEITQAFLSKFNDLLTFLIPHYQREGKSYLTIAIGCTGGHHRSVAIVENLCENLRAQEINTLISHRDLNK